MGCTRRARRREATSTPKDKPTPSAYGTLEWPDFDYPEPPELLHEAKQIIRRAQLHATDKQYDRAPVVALRRELQPEQLINAATLAVIHRLNWARNWFEWSQFRTARIGERRIIANPSHRAIDETRVIIDACERELSVDSRIVSDGGLAATNPHRLAWQACCVLDSALSGIPLSSEADVRENQLPLSQLRIGRPFGPILLKLRRRFDWPRLRAMVLKWEIQVTENLKQRNRAMGGRKPLYDHAAIEELRSRGLDAKGAYHEYKKSHFHKHDFDGFKDKFYRPAKKLGNLKSPVSPLLR